jgi:hypothetical protein
MCHKFNSFNFAGDSITIPTGRETYGANLVSNEEDIKNQLAKFKEEWPTHGVIIMCDLWTGTIGISIINFMVYYNGIMLFHISVDWTRHNKDTYFIYVVTTLCQTCFSYLCTKLAYLYL